MDDNDDILELACQVCGHIGLEDGSDGYYYCQNCSSQAVNVRDTGDDLDEFIDYGNPSTYARQRQRRHIAQPVSQSQPQSQFWESLKQEEQVADAVGPTEPVDFGTDAAAGAALRYEDYYSQIRLRYVMGVQVLIQLQCKALVEMFGVNEKVVAVAGNIWLRFVALSGVFADDWADEAITQSESQIQEPVEGFVPSGRHRDEPHNILGQRAVFIWYRSLRKAIPLSNSLAISFLACHVLREAILPTDILKWILEGKLPYFAAFADIEKEIDPPPKGCPISSSRMFRPIRAVSMQKLESSAATIAEAVGLELPPVNFFAIASRYLQLMSLPVDKILPHACRIYEWSTPPECWLSANELRLPTRVYVLSILIVSIRILYNINGFGYWEDNFSGPQLSSTPYEEMEHDSQSDADMNDSQSDADINDDAKYPSTAPNDDANHPSATPNTDTKELLLTLDSKYKDLLENFEYTKDLPTYLLYCKKMVFAGDEPSYEDTEESTMNEDFWNKYQRHLDMKSSHDHGGRSSGQIRGDNKRSREENRGTPLTNKKKRDDEFNSNTQQSTPSQSNKSQNNIDLDDFCIGGRNSIFNKQSCHISDREKAVNRLKSNMEDNRFCYIPPRPRSERSDYLHYARKIEEGSYTYIAHADYYILLRSCARVAQIDIRSLHTGVLNYENRLAWLEKRIDYCMHVKLPTDTCEDCRDEEVEVHVTDNSLIGLSKLKFESM